MATGAATNRDIAANWAHGVESAYWPVMFHKDIVNVKSDGRVRNCHEIANSVQPLRNPKKPVTANAGTASGKMILKKT